MELIQSPGVKYYWVIYIRLCTKKTKQQHLYDILKILIIHFWLKYNFRIRWERIIQLSLENQINLIIEKNWLDK